MQIAGGISSGIPIKLDCCDGSSVNELLLNGLEDKADCLVLKFNSSIVDAIRGSKT